MNWKDDAREKMAAATQSQQAAIAASAIAAAAKDAADAAARDVVEVKFFLKNISKKKRCC